MCRYVAKNIVAAKLAEKCEVQVAYAIGYPEPLSINVDTYGTGALENDNDLENVIRKVFDMTPSGIVRTLGLKNPKKQGWSYQDTAAYGHFGRNIFPWEKTDKAEKLIKVASKFLKKKKGK
jgi:S-adenosylmethionine synthetase